MAIAAQVELSLQEQSIPICETVQGACEILGLDPLYIANEGRFIAFVPKTQGDAALQILRNFSPTHGDLVAQQIGVVRNYTQSNLFGISQGFVKLHHEIGGARILDYLSGEQLPRMC